MEPGSSENVARLRQEYLKAVELSKERIQKWYRISTSTDPKETFKSDYECLQAQLHSLPDKISHDIMVPFGRFAFMPGELYHTNELLVLLGDNWFAKRSAKQAVELVQRRKLTVMKHLEDEKKQLQDWEARFAFTKDMQANMEEHRETVEIKEEYKPTADETGTKGRVRKAHTPKASVPPPRPAFSPQQQQQWRPPPTREVQFPPTTGGGDEEEEEGTSRGGPAEGGGGASATVGDEGLWSRLEQLELKEEDGDGEESKESEGLSEQQQKKAVITIQHTTATSADSHGQASPLQEGAEGDTKPLFANPGDIFKQFCKPAEKEEDPPPSLETGAPERSVKWAPQLETRQTVEHAAPAIATPKMTDHTKQTPSLAFSGQVVERAADSKQPQAGPRKVSKFKASRLHNKPQ